MACDGYKPLSYYDSGDKHQSRCRNRIPTPLCSCVLILLCICIIIERRAPRENHTLPARKIPLRRERNSCTHIKVEHARACMSVYLWCARVCVCVCTLGNPNTSITFCLYGARCGITNENFIAIPRGADVNPPAADRPPVRRNNFLKTVICRRALIYNIIQ